MRLQVTYPDGLHFLHTLFCYAHWDLIRWRIWPTSCALHRRLWVRPRQTWSVKARKLGPSCSETGWSVLSFSCFHPDDKFILRSTDIFERWSLPAAAAQAKGLAALVPQGGMVTHLLRPLRVDRVHDHESPLLVCWKLVFDHGICLASNAPWFIPTPAWYKEDIDRPFQSLDFLVRDWRHFRCFACWCPLMVNDPWVFPRKLWKFTLEFQSILAASFCARDDWTVEQCKEQMEQSGPKENQWTNGTEKLPWATDWRIILNSCA